MLMSLVASLMTAVTLVGLVALLASNVEKLGKRYPQLEEHTDAIFVGAAALLLAISLRIAFYLGGVYL